MDALWIAQQSENLTADTVSDDQERDVGLPRRGMPDDGWLIELPPVGHSRREPAQPRRS